MIRIAISQAAFAAIAKTLPLGSVSFENKINDRGERYVWLTPNVVDRLRALRGPGEDLFSGHPEAGQGEGINEIELSEFRAMIDAIMNNPEASDAEKRRAIAMLWTGIETDEIENAAQYEKYKEEYREIEQRAGVSSSDFAAFLKSSEGQEFRRSQDFMRWMALGGEIMRWEDNPRAGTGGLPSDPTLG